MLSNRHMDQIVLETRKNKKEIVYPPAGLMSIRDYHDKLQEWKKTPGSYGGRYPWIDAPGVIKSLVAYDPEIGEFKWKARYKVWFNRKNEWQSWNTRYAGQPTATNRSGISVIITVQNQTISAARAAHLIMTDTYPRRVTFANGDTTDLTWGNIKESCSKQSTPNLEDPMFALMKAS